MSGIKPLIDLMLGIKVLRPSVGRWSVMEAGRTWSDFDNCRATAVRSVRVGWSLRRCWVTVVKMEVNALAAFMAYGQTGVGKKRTFLHFTFYVNDPRLPGKNSASATLGGGLTIPQRLPDAYRKALLQQTQHGS